MRTAVLAVVIALALVTGAAPGAAQSGDVAAAGVTIDVHVAQSGDAVWEVSTAFALDDADDREAFRRLAEEIANGSSPPGFDADTAAALVAAGDERTPRDMTLTDVEQSTRLTENGTRGVVTLSFRWTAFAAANGDTVAVGDAFGSWTLTESQRLRLHPPEDAGLLSVEPDAETFENGTLTWTGERSFDAGEPAVTYTRSVTPTQGPTGTPTDGGPSGASGPGTGFYAAVAAALVLGGAVGYLIVRRDRVSGSERGSGDGADGPGDPPDPAAAAPDDAPEAEPDPVDPELLSDEERVERLLDERGGRMKQADIVSETGWSNAKVSQLLSGMAEEDRVEKLRIGRENLITLPDAESPADGASGDDGS